MWTLRKLFFLLHNFDYFTDTVFNKVQQTHRKKNCLLHDFFIRNIEYQIPVRDKNVFQHSIVLPRILVSQKYLRVKKATCLHNFFIFILKGVIRDRIE